MEQNPTGKVSLIVPCYNVERYLSTFFLSVIQQTYQNIELILVNDGSTDGTDWIISTYTEQLTKRLTLKYVIQHNKGLGGAINTGLKLFTGDYLCWADPDDYLEAESVEKRVLFLNSHPEIGMVTTDASIRNGGVEGEIIGYISDYFSEYNESPEQFELALNAKSILCSGCHMIRKEVFLDVNPNCDIYEARRGQNWQLLLPVYYKYKRGFLNEALYRYVVREDSMDQGDNDDEEKQVQRAKEHKEIIIQTLDRIDMPDRERKKYKKHCVELIASRLFYIAIQNNDFFLAFKSLISMAGSDYLEKSMLVDSLCLLRKKTKIRGVKEF